MRCVLRWLLLAALCGSSVYAQVNTGSVFGNVSDAQGRAVTGATVTVRSSDLSAVRSAVSDARGHFGLSGLAPGAYVVEAQELGLVLRHPIRLTVGLGSSTQLALRLDVARVQQKVTVSGGRATSEGNSVAPPINKSELFVGNFFAGTVVTYLPNRDRDVTQFDQLSANAHEDSEGTGVDVDGQRPDALLTQLDGVDFDSPLFGGIRGAEDRSFLLPQTVVREFQIVSSGIGAEVGKTSAGLINVATKEGSNKFHGEAFYTIRTSALTSADAFGNSPDNFQSIYGGSLGGALRRDRSFFYSGFEQDFLHAPRFVAFEPQGPDISIPEGLSDLQGQIVEHNMPLAYSARIDQILNIANTLNVEAVFNRIRITNLGEGLTRSIAVASNSESLGGQSIFTRAGLTTVLDTHSVNQALVSWSSDHRVATPNSTTPELFINGFGILGGNVLGLHRFTSQQLQLGDGISISKGESLFQFGGNFSYDPTYEQREENLNGRFDYNSLADYIFARPRRFQQTFITGDTRYRGAVRDLAVYANAHLNLTKTLSIAGGLRWAGQWNPQPPHPNASLSQTQQIPDDFLQWQPRLGVAWNPLANTTVRFSSGIFNAPVPATIFHRVFADNGSQTIVADSYFDPQILTLTGAEAGLPQALSTPPAGLSTPAALVEGIDPHFRNPSSLQAAVTIDQTVSSKLTLRAGYLHASTWRLQHLLDENLYPPEIDAEGMPVFPQARPISGVGRLLINQSSAHSSYSSLSLSAISQISRRSELTANYTLSQTYDDDSNLGPYSIVSALDPFDLQAERAYSALDLRQVLNVSAIFNLPLGFKLNPLLMVHSAPPYTAIIGYDTQNDANDFNDRAIVKGSVTHRNIFRQPAFSDADLRIVKDFTLRGDGHHLDLFMDVFNIAGASNRNFGAEQVSFYGSPEALIFSGGTPLFAPDVARVGGPREIQFTARLVAF